MIGTTVGNYKIVERLGDGGMGAVYRAVDQMLDRDVAIKVLKPELARNAALIERFRQEAIALARLNHPRIATLHGLERHGDSLLMIMEYVRGDTFEAVVQRNGRIAWPRAAELCAATLDALDHAHDKGVVHRDIKPANIMLASNGAVKVMDFGIARLIGKSRQTQVGHAVGTPMYMAPEQLRGEEVDGRTDLYATGAVLFELVTGRMAFEADSDYALMMMQLNDPPPAASSFVSEVPPAIDAVIARAMSKRREDRFPSANAFRDALLQIASSYTPVSRRAAPVETRLAPDPAPAPNAGLSSGAGGQLPETRLGSPSDVRNDGAAATRLAPNGPPATRLAPDATPATRLAPDTSAHATARTTSRTTTERRQHMVADLARDWRTYAIAGAIFVGAGVGVRMLRSDPNGPGPSGERTTDTTAVVKPTVAARDTTPSVPTPAQERPRENADQLIINPPAKGAEGGSNDGGRSTPPTEVAQKPPSKSGGSDTRGGRPVEDKPAEKVVAPAEPPVSREPSDAEVESAIRDALHTAATSLSGRNSAAASVLGGNVQDQWIAYMKEGRVSLNVIGSPEIQRRGSSASAEFDASVNVRSPFGANRRQSARFAAELQQSGGGWRVVSLRPTGGLDLK